MNTAVEWKDVLIESIKGAFILALLERLYVTRANSWFEDHIGAGVLGLHYDGATWLTYHAQIIIACRVSCSTTQP